MTTAFEVSESFTEKWADLAPISATSYGISGRDHLPGDYSPDGHRERVQLYRRTRAEMVDHLDDEDPIQARAAKVTVAWLDHKLADHDDGKWRRDLNHIYSPFQVIRDVFDVMDRDTPEGWQAIAGRMSGYPEMLDGYQQCLSAGVSAGDTAARRQAESVLEQAEAAAGDDSRFLTFPEEAARVGGDAEVVAAAVEVARGANARFADWMRGTYLPATRSDDAVGRERYLLEADEFLGMDLDPEEAYEWAWGEIFDIRKAMKESAERIEPGKTVEEVIHILDTDPTRSAETREDFVEFVSSIQQRAILQLSGDHFEVPEELRTVTVNMAPPGGSLGAWYVSPSEDFSRPGSIWYAPGSRTRIPYWQEVTTAYHEGFPGHHLQVATAVYNRASTSRFHRSVIWYSGAGEGWALYAERLMDELGYFENPEFRLGWLASQMFRSVRVVFDIGAHLGLAIPDHAPMYPGEVWNFEIGVDYLNHIGLLARDVAESEVKRYLGWWGQAISYKLGEREILDIRDTAMRDEGIDFDQKEFHRRMLEAGAIRLDHLRDEMLRTPGG